MKISQLRVESYGLWTDLELGRLSERLTVFYGANESGKTTLLQFIRAILYGYAAAPRQRYASTRSGRRPEGSLEVLVTGGRYTVSRTGRRDGQDNGKVTIRSADGASHRAHQLGSLLSDVDENSKAHQDLEQIDHLIHRIAEVVKKMSQVRHYQVQNYCGSVNILDLDASSQDRE